MTLTEKQAERLIRLYAGAEKEILAQTARALLRGNSTRQLDAMRRGVRAIRKDLLAGGWEWADQAIPLAYKEGIFSTKLPAQVGFDAVHQQAVHVLAENAYGRMEQVDHVIGRRVDDIYRAVQLENITGQVTGHQTWQQTAQRIREDLAKRGITGFVDRAGREWNMETYAEMLARTTTREAMVEGTKNRLLENDYDLAEIVGGSTERTCDVCRRWLGKIVSLSGKTRGYPTLADAQTDGLFHPNCTHNIAIAGSFEEAIGGE